MDYQNVLSFLTREGLCFRLENIVRGHAVNESDDTAAQNVDLSTNDQSLPTSEVEISTDNQEITLPSSENVDMQEAGMDDRVQTATTARLEMNTSYDSGTYMEEPPGQAENLQEEEPEQERGFWRQPFEEGSGQWQEENGEQSGGDWRENVEQAWARETPQDDGGEDDHLQEVHEEWRDDESHDTVENWQEDRLEPLTRRVNEFIPPDDDNVYSMELRELLSRYLLLLSIYHS